MSKFTTVTPDEILHLFSLEGNDQLLNKVLQDAVRTPENLVMFVGRYANFNAWFGSNVAALSGHIGRARRVFMDPEEEVAELADRSVLVASYFFDAARDEFDDRDTPHRDTHRCLAQALLKGIIKFYAPKKGTPSWIQENYSWIKRINYILDHPVWLNALGNSIEVGYGAVGDNSVESALFRSMGYHVGSEILADQEFTKIDHAIRSADPELVRYLQSHTFDIAGQRHNGYSWISLHSSYGQESSAKEMEHFQAALDGVEAALKFVSPALRASYRHQLHLGVLDFEQDHREFFTNVME